MLSERASLFDQSDHGIAFKVSDRDAEQPIIQEDTVARAEIAWQVRIGARHLSGRA
jgi:hypothetical protein